MIIHSLEPRPKTQGTKNNFMIFQRVFIEEPLYQRNHAKESAIITFHGTDYAKSYQFFSK